VFVHNCFEKNKQAGTAVQSHPQVSRLPDLLITAVYDVLKISPKVS
jgi:hypothetical protein